MKKNPKQQIAGAINALYDNVFKLAPSRMRFFSKASLTCLTIPKLFLMR